MKERAIIVDIDGTLSNIDHRRPELEAKKWDEFFGKMGEDGLHHWCADLMRRFQWEPTARVLLVTGRPSKYKAETLAWLHKHNVMFHELHMRGWRDYRPDAQVKFEIYAKEIQPRFDVMFVVEDRQRVVDMWRENGLVVLQCAKGDY